MNASRFDHSTTRRGAALTRRRTLRGLLLGVSPFATLFTKTALLENAAAKKKRKKKRCKGDSKRCGKRCIPLDACCNSGDCGTQEDCIGGKCAVPCGPACDAISGFCATTVSGADVCIGAFLTELLCAANPCADDSQCAATEICFAVSCPPSGEVESRCLGLLLP